MTQRARRIRPAAVVVCLVATTLGISTCRNRSSGIEAPSTLQIGVALPPAGTAPSVGVPGFVSLLTTESLVGIGWDGRPSPKIVAEWTPYADGRRVRLRVFPNIRFHNDELLTATLVREILLKEIRNENAPLSYSSITGIEVVDEDEIDIALSRPETFLITDLNSTSVTHPRKPEWGTGPYRISSRKDAPNATQSQKEYATLEAYPSYYRGRPRTQFVDVKAYSTQRNAWAALMRGEINALHEVSAGAIDFVEKESSVRTYSFLRGYYTFLAFNMVHPVLARRDVRQALSQAVNREEIVKTALRGRGQPADGPIWPFHWAYSTAQRGYTYNQEAARLRLDAAGFTMPTQRITGGMPSRLRFSCLTLDDPRYEQTAMLLQKQLFDIGVDMEIEARPFREVVMRMSEGKFDALMLEYTSGRSLAWTYYGWHSSHPVRYSPRTGYKTADDVLDRLRAASSDQDIRAHVNELQRTFYDDPPAIFIAWPYSSRAVSRSFSVPQQANADILGNVWQWQAQPAQVARR